MKIYSFEYDGYGESYHVMSDSPASALEAVKKYTKSYLMENDPNWEEWRQSTLVKLPSGYYLVEYGQDDVIQTEVS